MRKIDRTGETRIMNNGLSAKIIKYRHFHDIDIEFENGGVVYQRSYNWFLRGGVLCPLVIESIGDYAKVANPNVSPGNYWLMDHDDIPLLDNKLWCVDNVLGYVSRGHARLHRVIMHTTKGEEVDHINGIRNDNRKSNLRLCTSSENKCNRPLTNANTSGYRGVRFDARDGRHKWRAEIKKNKKIIWLGYFDTAEQAAIAYNEAAIIYHGEFARLNNI